MALGYQTAALCLWGRDRLATARLFTEVPGGSLRHMASAETREVQPGDQEQPFRHEDSLAVRHQRGCAIAMQPF